MNPRLSLAAIALLLAIPPVVHPQSTAPQEPASSAAAQIEYRNAQYGFCFALPASWKG